jgi:Na+-transporting NADH:ubiquinone oxidoreductase subunit NqrC
MMPQLPLLLAQETVVRTDEWTGSFFGLDQEQRFILLILTIISFTLISIVISSIIATVYSGMHRRQAELELKQEMLDRDMSAEEIAEVIKAAPIEDLASRWVEGWKQKRKGS